LKPDKVRISVCMIVKDESERLPGALESVKGLAEEIIVVDTGSIDDSIEVARSFGARVIEIPWHDDFAEARNVSLDAASGEWVLCLDADETLPPQSTEKIIKALSGRADAYFVRIESRVDSKAGKIFVNFFPRLFKNLDGVCFEGRVHEQIYPSLERLAARVDVSDIVIKHAGYALSAAALREKAARNADILTREIEADPNQPLVLFHLGEAYSMMEDHAAAADHYRAALKAGKLPHVVLSVVLQNLGSALVRLGQYRKARAVIGRALETDPGLLTAHLVLASAFFGLGKFDRAEREISGYIERATQSSKIPRLTLGHEPNIPGALVLLAKCKLARGAVEETKDLLKQVTIMDGSCCEAHLSLARIAFEELRFGQAATHYEEALKCSSERGPVYFELARSYVACGSNDKAIATVEAALTAGCGSSELLRCLGILKIKKRDFEGAIEAYRAALELDPADSESKRKLAGLYHTIGKTEVAKHYLSIH
jgi:tetratricopeptide (TPR) repeat protein